MVAGRKVGYYGSRKEARSLGLGKKEGRVLGSGRKVGY